MEWTEDAISRLRMLWAEGHSTAEIGRRMGISKNAVVGKAHRLELPPRPSPIRREGSAPRAPRRAVTRRVNGPTLPSLAGMQAARPAPSPPPAAVVEPAPRIVPPRDEPVMRPVPDARPVVRPVTISRSSNRHVTCCWPIGEPGTAGFRFCDEGATNGKPYCSEHAALAYVKVRDRRDEAA